MPEGAIDFAQLENAINRTYQQPHFARTTAVVPATPSPDDILAFLAAEIGQPVVMTSVNNRFEINIDLGSSFDRLITEPTRLTAAIACFHHIHIVMRWRRDRLSGLRGLWRRAKCAHLDASLDRFARFLQKDA
ncbi:MAG: hypothetical protein Q7R83_03575 [bacterium]|nr:hypothetical protein [bacterium]